MSILKTTNSGRTGIIKAHILGDKYDHQDGGRNYYYKTPYSTQPPFFVFTYTSHDMQSVPDVHYAVNVFGVDSFSAVTVKIETLDELKFIESYWDELIAEHDSITSLVKDPNRTVKLQYLLNIIKKKSEKYVNTTVYKLRKRLYKSEC